MHGLQRPCFDRWTTKSEQSVAGKVEQVNQPSEKHTFAYEQQGPG